MSLLLLLRADPRATLAADQTSGDATLIVTFTVDDLDGGVHAGETGPIWQFDPGDGSDPLYWDAGAWTRTPAGTGDTPTSSDPIVYAYLHGSAGPFDAVLSFVTDDGTYPAARVELDIDDGLRPHGTITTDTFAGAGTLDVQLTVTLDDDAGLTVTGWDLDFGDGSFNGITPGIPSGDVVLHTYTAPFFGAPHLLIYTDEVTP